MKKYKPIYYRGKWLHHGFYSSWTIRTIDTSISSGWFNYVELN
jgi:hypothetical protein